MFVFVLILRQKIELLKNNVAQESALFLALFTRKFSNPKNNWLHKLFHVCHCLSTSDYGTSITNNPYFVTVCMVTQMWGWISFLSQHTSSPSMAPNTLTPYNQYPVVSNTRFWEMFINSQNSCALLLLSIIFEKCTLPFGK